MFGHNQPVILDYLASKAICSDDLVVVSPDVGGVARARAFAKKLSDAPLAIVDKRRHGHNVAEVRSAEIYLIMVVLFWIICFILSCLRLYSLGREKKKFRYSIKFKCARLLELLAVVCSLADQNVEYL